MATRMRNRTRASPWLPLILFDEVGVWHDDRDVVVSLDGGAAGADVLNLAGHITDLDPVADLDRPLCEHDQPADKGSA